MPPASWTRPDPHPDPLRHNSPSLSSYEWDTELFLLPLISSLFTMLALLGEPAAKRVQAGRKQPVSQQGEGCLTESASSLP